MIAVKGVVSGKVQRVWFRRFVQSVAEPLGIAGYAKNLPDGSVEVVLHGSETAVRKCQEAVAKGPPGARVDALVWTREENPSPPQGFQVY